jgi:hypothetical protein
MSTEELIALYQQHEAKISPSQCRRNKSVMQRRELGTIKRLAKRKAETSTDYLDCILRVLRLRSSKEARRFLVETLARRANPSGRSSDRPLPPIPTSSS